MFSLRAASRVSNVTRAFSTTAPKADMAKLVLIGRLGKEPEVKVTASDREFISYTLSTRNDGKKEADGTRAPPTYSWHRIVSFAPSQIEYIKTLEKGSKVYVEAKLEIKEGDREAEPGSPQSQRQILLQHINLRLLSRPIVRAEGREGEQSSEEHSTGGSYGSAGQSYTSGTTQSNTQYSDSY